MHLRRATGLTKRQKAVKHSYPDRYSMEYCDVIVLKIFAFIHPHNYGKISALEGVSRKCQKFRIR